MKEHEKEWFLNLPKDVKLDLIKDAYCTHGAGMYLKLAKVLLDAPITKGGIATEELKEVFNELQAQ